MPEVRDDWPLATAVPDPDRAKLPQRSGAERASLIPLSVSKPLRLEVGVVVIGGLMGSSACGGLVKISTKSAAR
jgi:hypothetical protein